MVYRDGSLEEVTYSRIRRKTRSGQENEEGKKNIAGKEKSTPKSLEKKVYGTLERRLVVLGHVPFTDLSEVYVIELSRFCQCKLLINESASPLSRFQTLYPSPLRSFGTKLSLTSH